MVIYVRRIMKYMNNQATNTAIIALIISHVIPVDILLYDCNLPPVAIIFSAFFESREDAVSMT
jgi:hypothetical protein